MIRFFGTLFAAAFILLVATAAGLLYTVSEMGKDLPDYTQLSQYEPSVTTRIHAGDGSLLAEYAKQRRLYVPLEAIPEQLINAFLSAEDKNFFHHGGFDLSGIMRATISNTTNYIQGNRKKLEGASTITQQVAKNFLLSNERSVERKMKELILARRIEKSFSKEHILELYLNEIYLGIGSYGVAAAALNYMGKPLDKLNLEEMAYLAALPKAPNNYHPIRFPARAIERRNWVLKRMAENKFISNQQMQNAENMPLNIAPRLIGTQIFANETGATFFVEEVRRDVYKLYGENKLYEGGLSVRTTLDLTLQSKAHKILRDALVEFDRKKGYRGPVDSIKPENLKNWHQKLADIEPLQDLKQWRLAVILKTDQKQAKIGLRARKNIYGKITPKPITGTLNINDLKWARQYIPPAPNSERSKLGAKVTDLSQVLKVGDVVYVDLAEDNKQNTAEKQENPDDIHSSLPENAKWKLMQIPEIEGAMIALDPHTGRVLALVGGFSGAKSQFNRAIQAKRQPGSAFKPFVYAAALDNGYTPASVIFDGPIAIVLDNGDVWEPKNYSDKFYGPSTLRQGIEKSRNTMTVRLARDMGIEPIVDIGKKVGIYDNLFPVLSAALGSRETTLIKITAAYGMFANGGKHIQPTLIDRIQNRWGKTIYQHDQRNCHQCRQQKWDNQDEPVIADEREQVINPYTAYQITSMMEGVVKSGTARRAFKNITRPFAGKTGTTNEERDTWFIGFTPDFVIGVYVGFDTPRSMGKGATGGSIAAPIAAQFVTEALENEPEIPFRIPAGITLIPIDPATGMRANYGENNTMLEAFKPYEDAAEKIVIIGENSGDNIVFFGETGQVYNGISQSSSGNTQNPRPLEESDSFQGTGGLY